jgi:hypothetical protein
MIPQKRRGAEKMKKSKVVFKKLTPAQKLLAMFEAAKSKK